MILFRSLFKLVVDVFISRTIENSEVSSAKSLEFVVKSSERSLLWIKNSSDPGIDSWGTPASILVHEEYFPFKTTLCFFKFKKSVMMSNSFPEIPFCFSLCSPLCQPYQMLLKCLKIYLETHQKIFKFHEWWTEIG